MGNLAVCCDGTWQNGLVQAVSDQTNIKLICDDINESSVKFKPKYVPGVGVHGLRDRLRGGLFGEGLDESLLDAYMYLVEHYADDPEPDKIFLFGFSRGAYTARTLAGMVARVGLLRRSAAGPASDEKRAHEALTLYREWKPNSHEAADKFHSEHCYDEVKIEFLGVFDTVGALGIVGITDQKYAFHDIKLGSHVRVARQALAIGESRMAFEPCLWEDGDSEVECARSNATPTHITDRDVQQVWFRGVHSDVGGRGNAHLSDITRDWMKREALATGAGLQFNTYPSPAGATPAQIRRFLGGVKEVLFRGTFVVHNVVRRVNFWWEERRGREVSHRFFGNGYRKMCLEKDLAVAVADMLIPDRGYRPANFERWLDRHQEPYPTQKI
ncbi:DUF2235 domain-containing protein [Smaragdicoccus niigatensis]|uniref:DUF2235 domain-containing protein n=1 Tax=Smaragdicoccus niigatensis TaxID=359359 RepID=UPI00035D466A|nr:DUF2235 domain-containing protein [Smaragdicoccus niigatensis]